jgi:hypothetical protein
MPVQSQAQRAYLNARFGHNWVKAHHFDQKGKLPMYAHPLEKRQSQHRDPAQMYREMLTSRSRRG